MGYNQETCCAGRAALVTPLESAPRRQTTPERVTIFTIAQAAIRRIASEKPGLGQEYALQARSTPLRYEELGRTSSSRYGGARHTRESPATRRPTNGPELRRRSQTPAEQNGRATPTGQRRARYLSQDRSHPKRDTSEKKRRGTEMGKRPELLEKNTRYRRARGDLRSTESPFWLCTNCWSRKIYLVLSRDVFHN